MKEYIVVEDPHHVGHRPITPTQYFTVVYAVAIEEEGRRLSYISRMGEMMLQLPPYPPLIIVKVGYASLISAQYRLGMLCQRVYIDIILIFWV